MAELLLAGVAVTLFVAYNVGGATTGPAFGPAVGAGVIGKLTAAGLMSVFFFLGAWTIGRRVVDTLGRELVSDPSLFTLPISIVVLLFIGGTLLVGNVTGAPSSTSMTAVGAIVGLGFAAGELNGAVVVEIVAWWIVSPVVGFWTSVMIGRYAYRRLDRLLAVGRSEGPLVCLDRSGAVPRPRKGPNTTRRELLGTGALVGIGCLMAFSSGTSNIANAIAPLVGNGALGMNVGILLGSAAVAVGAFTIARRTMDTLGNDITDLSLTAAVVVAALSSLIVVVLSAVGVPASFVIISTMCIVGLGWGRASRTETFADALRGRAPATAPDGSGTGSGVGRDGGESRTSPDGSGDATQFDLRTAGRVVALQHLVPLAATVGSYLTFEYVLVP